MSEDNKPDV